LHITYKQEGKPLQYDLRTIQKKNGTDETDDKEREMDGGTVVDAAVLLSRLSKRYTHTHTRSTADVRRSTDCNCDCERLGGERYGDRERGTRSVRKKEQNIFVEYGSTFCCRYVIKIAENCLRNAGGEKKNHRVCRHA
jgi:hypothetical protein